MSILSEATAIMRELQIPVDVGKFKNKPPDEYVVFTPLDDVFEVFADNEPSYETQAVRISLYKTKNYRKRATQIVRALMAKDMTITGRKFIEFENDTSYYHYVIDAEKEYILQEEEEN